MSKSKNKVRRYINLLKTVNNWPSYLLRKVVGFEDFFEFDIKNLGFIKVQKNTMGPFRENFFDGVYLSKLPKKLFENPKITVIDIGANIGFFSLSFLSKYPEAKIFAFEPHPYCYEQLQQYKKEFSRYDFNIYMKAIGESNGKLTLFASKLDGFATMSSIFENDSKQEKFEIESVTLESVLKDESIDHIDLLKLDCEGSEYPIIYSATDQVLNKIGAFCIETHLGKKENENLASLVDYLEKKNFNTEYLDEGNTGYIWSWR